MKARDFFAKFIDRRLWANLIGMAVVVFALFMGVKIGLERYTHHGEAIPVPDVCGMDIVKARALLESDGLRVAVNDTGYNKRLPADCVLLQTPEGGAKVKSGRIVYVTINTLSSPTRVVPDIIDNSSVRNAEARLKAMGFRLLDPELVSGEKDWVYGIKARGVRVHTGDRVPIDVPLTLLVGSGSYDDDMMDINYVDAGGDAGGYLEDDFEEVTAPPVDGQPAGDEPSGAAEGEEVVE